MKLSSLFIALAFIYTIAVILWASTLPLHEASKLQGLFGVVGMTPIFFAPLALPAFLLLIAAMWVDS